jgi:hypothetical protein
MLQLHVDTAVQIRLLWTDNPPGVTTINVINGSVGSAFVASQTIANSLDTAIKSAVTTSGLVSHLHSNTQLLSVGLRDIRTVANVEYLGTGATVIGTGTGDPLPRGVSLVVTLRTAKAGRSYRGRVYLSGFTEADNDTGGNATAALSTAAGNFVTAIQTALNGQAITMGVLSRNREMKETVITTTHSDGSTSVKRHLQSSSVGFITPLSGIQVRNLVWDSQRRRTAPGSVSTFASVYSNMELAGSA